MTVVDNQVQSHDPEQGERVSNTGWGFLDESRDKAGRFVVSVGILSAGGVWYLGSVASEALRPFLGQSAPTVVWGGMALVTVGGVTYVIRRWRKGRDDENGDEGVDQPTGPQPLGFIDQMIARTIPNYAVDSPPAARSQRTAVTVEAEANETNVPVERQHTIVNDAQRYGDYGLEDSIGQIRDIASQQHLLILAGTRAGKTVFVHEVIKHAMQEKDAKFFVIDGKPEGRMDRKWIGATRVVTQPSLFVKFLAAAANLVEQRSKAGPKIFPPTWFVIDEAQKVTGEFPLAVDYVADILSRGASFNVHIVLMSQASTIANIGFEGRYDVLNHNAVKLWLEHNPSTGERTFGYARIKGGQITPMKQRFVTPVLPAPWADVSGLERHDASVEILQLAMFDDGGATPYTNGVNGGANHVAPVVQVAPPVESAPTVEAAPVYRQQMAVDDAGAIASVVLATMTSTTQYMNGQRQLSSGEVGAISLLHSQGWSMTKICEFVFGSKNVPNFDSVRSVLDATFA
jgi:hypothetical protein